MLSSSAVSFEYLKMLSWDCRDETFKCCSKAVFNIKQVQLYRAFWPCIFLLSLHPFSVREKSWGEDCLLGKF